MLNFSYIYTLNNFNKQTMKKIYITICALAISVSAIAQSSLDAFTVAKGKKSNKLILMNAEKSTPFWSEDFANGIPTTWTNSTAPWVYRGTSTSPNNTVGGQGAYSGINNSPASNSPIASATASNGFIIFDSDFYDNNGTPGAFGTGMYPTPHNGDLRTDMIDMSSYADVMLTFNSYYRTFAGQAFVDFYVAGVFVERVQVHANIAVNDATFMDEIALVRVPFSVVGNSDVQMSFVFEGSTNSNNGFTGYYFWQIDDLTLAETPANIIEVEDVVVGGFWMDYANYSGLGFNGIVGLDYTVTPTSQLANHPYVIEGVLRNSGASDQASILRYEAFGTGAYSGASASTSVLAFSPTNTIDSVVVTTTPSLSPAIGGYGIAIWGESDSSGVITTVSDTTYKMIEISEYIYAKDLGEANSNNSWILGGPGDQWHFTTRFEMYADEALSALRVYITDESVIGSEVKAILYELDTNVAAASGGVVLLDESDNYTITSNDLGSWVDIPFVSPINLFNGYAYEFGIAGFQHPTDSVYIGTTDNSLYNGEHSLFDEFGLNPNDPADLGTPTWYYLTRAPMVRMNFDPSLIAAVSDVKQTVFNTFPNPTNGIFTIELEANKKYDVTVNNAIGQTVILTTIRGMNTTIDLSNFGKGVYTVELKNNSSTYVEKVIVE
jgi:hypothetical protein